MPPHFQAMPRSVVDADAQITLLLLAWRDWIQARVELAENLADPTFHDRLAEKSHDLRLAFVGARRYFRILQQSRHIRGGALRGALGKTPLRDRCNFLPCALPSGHDGPHMGVLTEGI